MKLNDFELGSEPIQPPLAEAQLEHPAQSHHDADEYRQVGDQVLRVTTIEPENPDVVRERDGIQPEHIGNRPMHVNYVGMNASGRTATKNLGI